MATFDRRTAYPRAVEELFSAGWPGFRDLADRHKASFTRLICSAHQHGQYAHSVYDDAIRYGYQTRDADFGRGRFQALNGKLGLFDVVEHWRKGDFTKAYRLTPEAQALIESGPLGKTTLVDANGTEMKKPAPFAIHSRDIDENPRRGKGNIPAVVPVDMDALHELLKEAWQWRAHYRDQREPPERQRLARRLAGLEEKERVEWLSRYLILPLTLLILRCDNGAMPRGFVEITYTEFPSGRLYSVAGVMQTVPREIRSAAMHGCWDYDVENCHFALLAQLSARVEIETPAIADYLHRKREIRETLATDLGVPVAAIKECLLALIYGAQRRTQSYYKNGREIEPAFVESVGAKAADLFEHPLFVALHHDLSKARTPILKSMPTHKGKLINPFGKGISLSEPPNRQLAHVMQGAEALILDTVIQCHGPDLRLLMHDGFVSAVPLDVADLERIIETATGFRVRLEQAQL